MGESKRHNQLKKKAAGPGGQVEVKLPGNRRLDARSKNGVATEIERGGTNQSIKKAIGRLEASKAVKQKLKVPNKDLSLATEVAKKAKASLEITNLSETKKIKI